jgi:hypothetical protein
MRNDVWEFDVDTGAWTVVMTEYAGSSGAAMRGVGAVLVAVGGSRGDDAGERRVVEKFLIEKIWFFAPNPRATFSARAPRSTDRWRTISRVTSPASFSSARGSRARIN